MHLVRNIKISDPLAVMFPYIEEIISAVNRVINSGIYVGGEEVSAFESEFSAYLNVNHTISTGSGTDALQLAFRALGLKSGDKIATVSHTSVATIAAIEIVGAIPILVDIDPETYTIDIESLQKTLDYHRHKNHSNPIKAIVPVHLYGHPADMDKIMMLAKEYDAFVIEDCAQAHGADINSKKCGTWGHAAAFSFYPTKNLACLGDGGAMTTNDLEFANKAKLIKEYGWKERFISDIPGINTRLDCIQAAILRVKLHYLDSENDKRISNSILITEGLNETNFVLPITRPTCKHVFHQYVIRTKNRNYLIRNLRERGISTNILYPVPVHLQPAYKNRLIQFGKLETTVEVSHEILCIPVNCYLIKEQINIIVNELIKGLHLQSDCNKK